MNAVEFVKSMAASTRAWRERALQCIQSEGCTDLSFRPSTGMSAFGWLLSHQAAAYDYILNMLIKGTGPKSPELFYQYRGDSSDPGDWVGTPLQEINDYFDLVEGDFISWIEHVSDKELNRKLEGPNTPQYFQDMRVIDAIADMFAHLNHHNGHLSALRGDWCKQDKE